MTVKFKIEKEGHQSLLDEEGFEKIFEVIYTPTILFKDEKVRSQIAKRCNRALKKDLMEIEELWLGRYYEEEIKKNFLPDIYIKWIGPVMEWGLFAANNIKKNTYVGEYAGIVRKYKKSIDDKNAYCFEYNIAGEKTPFTIDAREVGNHVRFINHSAKPNLSPCAVILDGIARIVLRANKEIPQNEQLTYDYGLKYWQKREPPENL